MKVKLYHILFSIFSSLSNKTKGFPLFVKYKILFGILIIGLTESSCTNKETISYYTPDIQDSIQTIQKEGIIDSLEKKIHYKNIGGKKKITSFKPDRTSNEDTIIISTMCYISIDIDNHSIENESKSAFEPIESDNKEQ